MCSIVDTFYSQKNNYAIASVMRIFLVASERRRKVSTPPTFYFVFCLITGAKNNFGGRERRKMNYRALAPKFSSSFEKDQRQKSSSNNTGALVCVVRCVKLNNFRVGAKKHH
jgi:hypothetical protein